MVNALLVSPIPIHWIVIYPVDSTIQRLNNWGLYRKKVKWDQTLLSSFYCMSIHLQGFRLHPAIGSLTTICRNLGKRSFTGPFLVTATCNNPTIGSYLWKKYWKIPRLTINNGLNISSFQTILREKWYRRDWGHFLTDKCYNITFKPYNMV